MMTRRNFLVSGALASVGAAAYPMFGAKVKKRKVQVGHTGITWRNDQVEAAVASIASLGYYGFETFGDNLIKWTVRAACCRCSKRTSCRSSPATAPST